MWSVVSFCRAYKDFVIVVSSSIGVNMLHGT